MRAAFTIDECVDGVTRLLGNRTDIQNDIPKWVKNAVLELGNKYPFTELRVGPRLYQLVSGVNEYSLDNWAAAGDTIDDITSFYLFFNGQSGPGYELKYRTLRVVEPLSQLPGVPFYYTETNFNTILLGQCPQVAFWTLMRYQKKHPFTETLDPKVMRTDPVYLPAEWRLIVEYAAAIFGATENRWTEQAAVLNQELYGAPKTDKSEYKPGIITPLVLQFTKDAMHNERQLNVMVDTYTR